MTNPTFDYFVILAEMRTGSNLLEATLASFEGISCFGEAFNPSFLGNKGREELLGITREMREEHPLRLITTMIAETEGLAGFRFFHDHDPRVLAEVLSDPRCAKIVLTRNPVESFVSLKIVQQTGQWKLNDLKNQKSAKATFDAEAFEQHLEKVQGFQLAILHEMQRTGQTAFYIDYEDLQDLDVLNGLAKFLGVEGRIAELPGTLKKQNPEEITDKVLNPEEMERALARLDRFNLSRTPNFEPRRGPGVPGFVAAGGAPLLYLPVKCGPEAQVVDWLSRIGEAPGTVENFSQKSLRQWMRSATGFRSFTVLRHPLARAHTAFCAHVLTGEFGLVQRGLRRLYKLRLPEDPMDPAYDLAAHREAFLGFLKFLRGNLSGQTSIRVAAAWASQSAVLQGYASVCAPDLVIREDRLAEGLAFLAAEVGAAPPALTAPAGDLPHPLAAIHDAELEAAAREAYARDYMQFGFGPWMP